MQAEAAGQTAATIPWSKYTHIIHSALRPTYTNGICGLDSNSGLLSATNIRDFVNAAHASDVKAIVGIREDDTREAIAACTASQNIAQFVELIRTFVANSGYDGVDLDWESGIIAPQYQDLIRRLRGAMPTATLSVAVGIAERFLTAAVQYDLDQINIRAYNLDSQDLTGSAIHYSWYHSPTLQGASTQDQAMDILTWYYMYAGNASSKLGLAVPFYGRIRKGCLNDSGTNGVTNPNQAWVGRAEIRSILYRDLVNSTYWYAGTRVWDDSRKSQYIQYRDGGCANDAFIPYLGPEQLQEIVYLIRANKLGGIATQDGDARYPLSTAIDDAMAATAAASAISKRSPPAAPSAILGRAAADAPPTPTPPSQLSLTVDAVPLIVTTSPLPAALTGAAYSQTLTATGTTPMTWTVTGGALPSGLTLGSSTGTISGTPTALGVFSPTVTATNASGSNSKLLSLTVNAPATPPSIVTTSPLPAALTGAPYSQTLTATGTTPMTWTVTSGALPSGLILGSSTGTISGTPTAPGVFTPTMTATNAGGANSKQLSLTVNAPPTPPSIVTTSPLPAALTGAAYSQTLTATGTTPMTWSVTGGALPSGLTLGSSTGTISGMPTALGVFTPTVTATNAGGSNSIQLSLTVNAPTFTYYVDSASGSDSNPGTQAAPWKTIARVNSTKLTPGQSVGFKRGGLWRETLTVSTSGTVGHVITFGAYGSGSDPIINGADIASSWSDNSSGAPNTWKATITTEPPQVFFDGVRGTRQATLSAVTAPGQWYWSSAVLYVYSIGPPSSVIEASKRTYCVTADSISYVDLRNLILKYAEFIGAGFQDVSHLNLQDSTISANYAKGVSFWGAAARSSNSSVQNSIISDNAGIGLDIGNDTDAITLHGNSVYNNCSVMVDGWFLYGGIHVGTGGATVTNHVIEFNTVYSNGTGFVTPGDDDGFGIHVDTVTGSGNVIRYNTIYSNRSAGILIELSSNISLYYNMVYSNHRWGIFLNKQARNNRLYHNVVYGNTKHGIEIAGTFPLIANDTTNNVVENNISVGNTTNLSASFGADNDGAHGYGNIYEYNCFGAEAATFVEWGNSAFKSTYAAWATAYAGATHSVQTDPLLSNPPTDFTLQPGSPAIGAGIYIPGVSTTSPPNVGAKW